jgi:hypothetical protein
MRLLIAGLVAAALAVVLVERGGDGSGDSGERASEGGDVLGALRTLPLPELDLAPNRERPAAGPRHLIARVDKGQTVELLDRPEGEGIARVAASTEFGSARALGAARVRPGWLGVTAPELSNGELGWVSEDDPAIELYETRFWLAADVSARRLELRHGGRLLDRFPITVGSPGSPTPLGRYAVTDALAGRAVGPYYGCCILALSGHQPNLPANWLGGDRIAIHGTPAPVGGASSAGCLRASNDDMVSLFARVPLGVPVFIRA